MENGNRRKLRILLLAVLAAVLLQGCLVTEKYESLRNGLLQEEEPERKAERSGKRKDPAGTKEEEKTAQEKAAEESEEELSEAQETDFPEDSSRYAESFVYQTLEEEAKQVYHEVLTAILGHQEKVELSTIDVDVLEEAYKAVCADNGGLYWISGYVYTQYTRGGEVTGMDFTPKYTMEYEEREQIQQKIDASVEELLAGISTTDSDYEKAKYVFEILVQNVDYDAASENNQNIISAFLNRATVCQGYACATQYLLRLLGIQSAVVTGNANGESHAWNLVRLDGEYYYMDTTWGNSRYLDSSSQIEKYVNYNYMAVTSEEIGRTHQLDGSFVLPECTSTADNYFIRENRYFAEWNPDRVGAVLAEEWNAGANSAAMKFASEEIYRQALDYLIGEQHIADYCEGISSIYYLEDKELYALTFHF